MNNKKLFASALVLSMFFGLTACSSEKPEDTKVVEKKEEKKRREEGRKERRKERRKYGCCISKRNF